MLTSGTKSHDSVSCGIQLTVIAGDSISRVIELDNELSPREGPTGEKGV